MSHNFSQLEKDRLRTKHLDYCQKFYAKVMRDRSFVTDEEADDLFMESYILMEVSLNKFDFSKLKSACLRLNSIDEDISEYFLSYFRARVNFIANHSK